MEYWDIYDKNKQLTGRTMKKNDWILKDGEYHLSVLGIIQHVNGKYLITQRVMTKAWAPGWWEVPGGACMAGESSEEAVLREVKEETGLDVSMASGGFKIILWMFINLFSILMKMMYRSRLKKLCLIDWLLKKK